MSSREEVSSEKNETEFVTPREGDEDMSQSQPPSPSSPSSSSQETRDPRRTTSRLYDTNTNNNNDIDDDDTNFDRDRTRIQIRDNFNNELKKLKTVLAGGNINAIYEEALENVKFIIPESNRFNLTFRKDKNGNYNGLIILNKFSKKKTPSAKALPPPPPAKTLPPPPEPGEPMKTMRKRTFAKIPNDVDVIDDNDNDDDQLVLPPTPTAPVIPRRRAIKNTDRKGAVRRPKTDQALESTVKSLASEIEKINNKLLKIKRAKNDKELMKAAKRGLKSMIGNNNNNNTRSQPQDYSNMFEKIYNEAYENSLNGGNNGYSVEDIKRDAIKYFH